MTASRKLQIVEWGAVLSGLAYTALLIQQTVWCWPFAMLSSLLFVYLVVSKSLYAETALHLFYFGMAIYGWYFFNQPEVRSLWNFSFTAHLIFIGSLLVVAVFVGFLLKAYTQAALPYLDSFTTVFSMGATLLMVNLILENWLYFAVINIFSVWLYAARKLWVSAGLMAVFAVMAIFGYLKWQ